MRRRRVTRPAADVWLLDAAGRDASAFVPLLGPGEADRARDLGEHAGGRFVLARALLRSVVAEASGLPVSDVVLEARCPVCGGRHGPVTVQRPDDPPLHVSLTRSGPLIAVAVSRWGPVGVDVESSHAVSRAPLGDVLLAPADRVERRGSPRGDADQHLAALWVRKEAVLKSAGVGLRTLPADVEIRGGRVRLGRLTVDVVDLPMPVGLHGAVAVARQSTRVPVRPRLGSRHVALHDGGPVLARHPSA